MILIMTDHPYLRVEHHKHHGGRFPCAKQWEWASLTAGHHGGGAAWALVDWGTSAWGGCARGDAWAQWAREGEPPVEPI
jgi:hypothetical protein